ncbi:MAG TPA: hypothetical protein VGE36_00225, partial [Roseateles sp.]
RHGFEYFRHGALSLYAAFNTKTGEVLGIIKEMLIGKVSQAVGHPIVSGRKQRVRRVSSV